MPLREDDIKSELSYAYLHAVASRAGCECQATGRHSDGMGVDARLITQGIFAPPPALTRVQVDVQFKETSQPVQTVRGRWAFPVEVGLYEKLRPTTLPCQTLLVLLLLPPQPAEWLKGSPRALTLKRCAYWVSLRGAAESGNTTTQTVYWPNSNRFTVDSLSDRVRRLARNEWVLYEP